MFYITEENWLILNEKKTIKFSNKDSEENNEDSVNL